MVTTSAYYYELSPGLVVFLVSLEKTKNHGFFKKTQKKPGFYWGFLVFIGFYLVFIGFYLVFIGFYCFFLFLNYK